MIVPREARSGLTLVEMMITTVLISALGLMIFAILATGTSLGAKNTAANVAHQQAREAMLHMIQHLHAAVSLPQLVDVNGNSAPGPTAPGISFQSWAGGPYQITQDTADAWQGVQVNVGDKPFNNASDLRLCQMLIIPGYQVDATIKVPSNWSPGSVAITPQATPSPTPAPVPISGTQWPTNYNVACFVTNRCYYVVNNGTLEWHYTDPATGNPAVASLATGVSATPFALNGNSVSINLSAEASNYSNQDSRSAYAGFKATKISLSETIPIRSKLTLLP